MCGLYGGLSVMAGKHSDMAAHIRGIVPQCVATYCVASRYAQSDECESFPTVSGFSCIIHTVFTLFPPSSSRTANFEDMKVPIRARAES